MTCPPGVTQLQSPSCPGPTPSNQRNLAAASILNDGITSSPFLIEPHHSRTVWIWSTGQLSRASNEH